MIHSATGTTENLYVQNANHRLEGIPPSSEFEEICAAYIRGEIEASDLVRVYKRMVQQRDKDVNLRAVSWRP
jgi:hypothetical protein